MYYMHRILARIFLAARGDSRCFWSKNCVENTVVQYRA